MKMKKVLVFFIVIFLLLPLFSYYLPVVRAKDWALQISDSKDADNDLDIKSLYARDDSTYLYFKIESYVNWNLEDNNGGLSIIINTEALTEPKTKNTWMLMIMEMDGEYIGMVADLSMETLEPVEIDFSNGSKSGTAKVSKSIIGLKTTKFSMATMVVDLGVSDDPIDVAPDNFKLVVYKPGGSGPAKLGVSTRTIDLGVLKSDDTALGNFDITNEGEGSIAATLKSSPNIRLSADEVTVGDYGSETVVVYVDASKLTPKTYQESIDIQSKFGNETVTVDFEVLPKPVLNVDVELLDFGQVIKGEKRAEKIRVSNRVKGSIKGTVSTTNKSILLSKSTFDSTSEEITVSISTKILDPGPIDGKIKIISNGGNATIDVTAEIINSLTIDKSEFDFGEINYDDQKVEPLPFTIKNQTDQSITLKISSSDSWISIGSEIKILANETKELKVTIKLDKMETVNKSYLGDITFESKYDKQVIPVKAYLKQEPPKTLWVTDPPDQKLVEEKLITGKIFEKIFTIKNDGSGTMNVSAKWEDTKSDFRLFNAKFVLKKGETADIKVKLDSTGLELGTYKNTLLIESNGGNLSIPITIVVLAKPIVVIKLYIGLSMAYIDQQQLTLEAPPYISKGTTMVPLRFISDAFKAKIEWFSIGKGRIILTVPTKSIQLDIGEKFAFINGEKLPLQAPPEIKTGRTFVPVRFIAEGLGARIEWKADTQQITIFYTIEE
jgi:hypothetical protein